jgi:hypothetical protein
MSMDMPGPKILGARGETKILGPIIELLNNIINMRYQ